MKELKLTPVPVVYVPVSVSDEYPEQNVKTIFFRGDFDTRIGGRGFEQPFTHWLKPTTNAYVLTPEQLLELRKKWAGEDFSAGYAWANEDSYCTERGAKPDPKIPNKTSYINNLTIE